MYWILGYIGRTKSWFLSINPCHFSTGLWPAIYRGFRNFQDPTHFFAHFVLLSFHLCQSNFQNFKHSFREKAEISPLQKYPSHLLLSNPFQAPSDYMGSTYELPCSDLSTDVLSALTSLPVPATEKHGHSTTLPSPCFIVAWWVDDEQFSLMSTVLAVLLKLFKFLSSDQRIFFLMLFAVL